MRWIWDPAKADANKRKHGVSFEVAQLVFEDLFALVEPDPHVGEQRWRTIGTPSIYSTVVLFVFHTWSEDDGTGEEVGRIVSARKATPQERKSYEEG